MKIPFNGVEYDLDQMNEADKAKLMNDMAFAKAAKEAGTLQTPGWVTKFGKGTGCYVKKGGQWIEDNPVKGTIVIASLAVAGGTLAYKAFSKK